MGTVQPTIKKIKQLKELGFNLSGGGEDAQAKWNREIVIDCDSEKLAKIVNIVFDKTITAEEAEDYPLSDVVKGLSDFFLASIGATK